MDGETRHHQALAHPSRVLLLEHLHASEGSRTADELAAALGLHPNTVRAHLQLLEEAGLAVSSREQRKRPGRPRRLFAAIPDKAEHDDALLSATLASVLESLPNGTDLAVVAGRSWGHILVDRLEPGQKPDETACIACVAALLRRWGFAPETTACGLVMHRCPFRDLADRFPSVVCALHTGLIDGALEELGAPVELEALERRVPPSRACLARLRKRAPAGD